MQEAFFFQHDKQRFEALQYEDNGQICVITGPVTEPRHADKEQILRIASCLILVPLGCVVVCTEFTPHQRQIGRCDELVGNVIRMDVHFEDVN